MKNLLSKGIEFKQYKPVCTCKNAEGERMEILDCTIHDSNCPCSDFMRTDIGKFLDYLTNNK